MKILLITIGILLALGGVIAITSPQAVVIESSGPDAKSDVARPTLEHFSKGRRNQTGYAALLLGLGVCVVGFLLKDGKAPEPHDNSA